jgi:hypothetical protein
LSYENIVISQWVMLGLCSYQVTISRKGSLYESFNFLERLAEHFLFVAEF